MESFKEDIVPLDWFMRYGMDKDSNPHTATGVDERKKTSEIAEEEEENSNSTNPYTSISQIAPGIFLCAENETINRYVLQLLGVKLVLTLNAPKRKEPYRVCRWAGKLPEDPDRYRFDAPFETKDEFLAELRNVCTEDPSSAVTPPYDQKQLREDHQLRSPSILFRAVAADDAVSFDLSPYFEELTGLMDSVLQWRRQMVDIRNMRKKEEGGEEGGEVMVPLPSVLVHCLAGVSRSATIVAAYLMRRTHAERDAVIKEMQKKRSCVAPNPGFLTQLQVYEMCQYNILNETSGPYIAKTILSMGGGGMHGNLQKVQALSSLIEMFLHQKNLFAAGVHFGRLAKELCRRREEDAGTAEEKQGDGGVHLVRPMAPSEISNVLETVMLQSMEDTAYLDCPFVFNHWATLCASVETHCPLVIACATDDYEEEDDEEEEEVNDELESEFEKGELWVWSDRWQKYLLSGFKDYDVTAEVIVRFFRALIFHAPQNLEILLQDALSGHRVPRGPRMLHKEKGESLLSSSPDHHVIVDTSDAFLSSFSLLALLAEHTDTFVPESIRTRLGKEINIDAADGDGKVDEEAMLAKVLPSALREYFAWFLVCTHSGACGRNERVHEGQTPVFDITTSELLSSAVERHRFGEIGALHEFYEKDVEYKMYSLLEKEFFGLFCDLFIVEPPQDDDDKHSILLTNRLEEMIQGDVLNKVFTDGALDLRKKGTEGKKTEEDDGHSASHLYMVLHVTKTKFVGSIAAIERVFASAVASCYSQCVSAQEDDPMEISRKRKIESFSTKMYEVMDNVCTKLVAQYPGTGMSELPSCKVISETI